MSETLTIIVENTTGAKVNLDYPYPGNGWVFSAQPQPEKVTDGGQVSYKMPPEQTYTFTLDQAQNWAKLEMAQYSVTGLGLDVPTCYLSFSESNGNWSYSFEPLGSPVEINGREYPRVKFGNLVKQSGNTFTFVLAWPAVSVDYGKLTGNLLEVTAAFQSRFTTHLAANVIPMNQATYDKQNGDPPSTKDWEQSWGYDSSRFALWGGGYCLSPNGDQTLIGNIKNEVLQGLVDFLKTQAKAPPYVLPYNGFNAYTEKAMSDYSKVAPALFGPAAVAASAMGETDFYNDLISGLETYSLKDNTPETTPDSKDFLNTTSAYFDGALLMLTQIMLAGKGSLLLTPGTDDGFASYAGFMANYQTWTDLNNGFLAPFSNVTVSDGLRVVFSKYNGPTDHAGEYNGNSPTVSEGMGYGLMFALTADDQTTFDGLLRFYLYASGTYGCAVNANQYPPQPVVVAPTMMPWCVNDQGAPFYPLWAGGFYSSGSATDADIQALWPIYEASQKVASGTWQDHRFSLGNQSLTYAEIARQLTRAVSRYDCYDGARFFGGASLGWFYKPGNQWGINGIPGSSGNSGADDFYPGYFTPQAMEILKKLAGG